MSQDELRGGSPQCVTGILEQYSVILRDFVGEIREQGYLDLTETALRPWCVHPTMQ